MLIVIVGLQVLIALLLVSLFVRKGATVGNPGLEKLNDAVVRLDGKSEAAQNLLREGLSQLRGDLKGELSLGRQEGSTAAGVLRGEVTRTMATLGNTITEGLGGFRGDLTKFTAESTQQQLGLREAMQAKLGELGESNAQKQESIRATLEQRLDKLNESNTAKLEEMRATVDEKLQATLHSRLTESFGQVTEQLGRVQSGLGEMKELAIGVGDLKRVFSNVKTRGGFAEMHVGMQLEQILAPNQYAKNVRIKPDTREEVEYAIRIPNGDAGEMLLPIDAKFPKEDWERLEDAYEHAMPDEIKVARRALEVAIRTEGKRICEKYVSPPKTTPYAIMYLPTEGLYAEVAKSIGLIAELQSKCQVTVAGPTNFAAILTSLSMGFHTVALQKKGTEVWRVLGAAKSEFEKFGKLMDRVQTQVGTVQNTLGEIRGKTTTINRALKGVSNVDSDESALVLEIEEPEERQPLFSAHVV